jgi:hypothetical protein
MMKIPVPVNTFSNNMVIYAVVRNSNAGSTFGPITRGTTNTAYPLDIQSTGRTLGNGSGQGGNGSLDGLLGMQIMEMMGKGMKPANNAAIDTPAVEETTDKKGKK